MMWSAILYLFQLTPLMVHSFGKNLSPEESLLEDTSLDAVSLLEDTSLEAVSLLEDTSLEAVEFAVKYGNDAERHNVITSDGYILEIHRILPSIQQSPRQHPVLLMHGLGSSSFDWIHLGPGKSLPTLLSALGFDVWLGNARGNQHARKHIKLDHNSRKFWMFSWHEIGIYDLPATIDYILNITHSNRMHYVGHSQGTTSFFVMASMKPEYNKKIQTMNALSPVVFMSRLESPVCQSLSRFSDYLLLATNVIGITEIRKNTLGKFGFDVCKEKSPVARVCDNIYFLIGGYNSILYNKTLLPVILSHLPAGFSMRQPIHYAQEIVSGRFRHFDYGYKNNDFYGTPEPPDYPLNHVTAPIALHWSEGDLLSHKDDVKQLSKKLCNIILNRPVSYKQFNHLDYMCAIDARKYVYDSVIEIITLYDGRKPPKSKACDIEQS